MAEPATRTTSTAPTPDFTEASARSALIHACQDAGITSDRLELVRLGSNAVFRLDEAVIARVAPSTGLLANARKQIDVARWLDSVEYPVTRALDVRQPIVAEARVVTFWESVNEETVYAPLADVAELIRRLHQLDAPVGLKLPPLRPFGPVGDPLPDFPGLPSADARFLTERIEWARVTFNDLPFVLPRGVVHGDANVGNVLCRPAGEAVLIDLDGFAQGPREWDLIQTAVFFDRFGWHSEAEYQRFVEVYGYDVMTWTGYEVLADMREIAMTTWLAKKSHLTEDSAREAEKRVGAIRSGGSRRDWAAY
jgi:aminoglycoside phosphotransferase (APT) family kinase protein